MHTLQRCRSLQSPAEGVGSPEPGGTGSCEPLAMGAGTELESSADVGRKKCFSFTFFEKRSQNMAQASLALTMECRLAFSS